MLRRKATSLRGTRAPDKSVSLILDWLTYQLSITLLPMTVLADLPVVITSSANSAPPTTFIATPSPSPGLPYMPPLNVSSCSVVVFPVNVESGTSASSFALRSVAPSAFSSNSVPPMRNTIRPPAGTGSTYSWLAWLYCSNAPSGKSVAVSSGLDRPDPPSRFFSETHVDRNRLAVQTGFDCLLERQAADGDLPLKPASLVQRRGESGPCPADPEYARAGRPGSRFGAPNAKAPSALAPRALTASHPITPD